MSLLERTRQIVPSPMPAHRRPALLATAAGYGAVGALALLLLLLIPVIAGWLADPRTSVSWAAAWSVAADGWVLTHRGSVGVPRDGVSITAPLLLLTGLAVLLARAAARAALAHLRGKTRHWWWQVGLAYVGGYAVTGAVIALLGWVGPARPQPLLVLPGAIVVAAVGLAWAVWRDHLHGAGLASDQLTAWGARVPAVVVRALRPALLGGLLLLLLGAALVALAVASSWSRVSGLNGELQAGVFGTTILTGAQLAAAPNLAAYAATWLSGAGLQLGSVSLGHAAITPGILPMVPVLGALPEAGAAPWWAPFTPLLPVAVGGFIGWRTLSGLTVLASLRAKVQTAAVAAALAAAGVLLIAFMGSMGLGGSALDYVGPSLIAVPLLLAEVVLGAVVNATVLHVWRTRR